MGTGLTAEDVLTEVGAASDTQPWYQPSGSGRPRPGPEAHRQVAQNKQTSRPKGDFAPAALLPDTGFPVDPNGRIGQPEGGKTPRTSLGELKRLLNRSIVEPLRDKTATGIPEPFPFILVPTQGS